MSSLSLNTALNVVGIHHVAFTENGTSTSEALHDLLGLEVSHTEQGDGFVERMIPVGRCYLQALEPTGPGLVESSVQRRGVGLHHLALQVTDLDAALAVLRERDVSLIDPAPRDGGLGTRVGFVHPRAFGGVLVELVEEPAR
jgi:methylmalonyl-CoA/ethylmalonyl-CoA epimerase